MKRIVLFLGAISAIVISCSKTSLGDNVFIERDLPNRQLVIHTSSSCSKIKNGYTIEKVSSFKYYPATECFCQECVYESDALELTKKE
jgi:hypothetical protein